MKLPSSPWTLLTCATLLSALAFAACDDKKDEGGAKPATSAGATTSAAATGASGSNTGALTATVATIVPLVPPSGSATGSAVASGTASGKPTTNAANTTATITTPTTSTTTTASAAPSGSGSTAAATCGGKDQPFCPLQGWMKANMGPAKASGDPAKLAAALRASAKFAPPGYANWAKYANDGATAVETAKDVKAGSEACKGCHGEYQKKYRDEMRTRPI